MGSRANRSGILSFTSLTSVAAIFSGSCRSTKWKSELGSAPLMSGIWPRRIRCAFGDDPAVGRLPEDCGEANQWHDPALDHIMQYRPWPHRGKLIHIPHQN